MKRRSKIVSFRLSDEEYNSLKSVSATRGARSVSEFTRSVACNTNVDGQDRIEETLRALNERMQNLDHKIQVLTDALNSATNSAANSATNFTNLKTEEPAE